MRGVVSRTTTLRIIAIPNSARSWIALIAGLVILVGVGWYAVFLGSSSNPSASGADKAQSAFIGTPQEVEQHRQALIDKYLDDYKAIHPDASSERRKLLDAAETYVNDRIAQSGEKWRFNKVTGNPEL